MNPPAWCNTPGMRAYWRNPHKVSLNPREARRFKRRLWRHGYLSPNFTRREAASKDGRSIPRRLRHNAQRQAFHLERVRHQCGDTSMTMISWYRSPQHNAAVGGAPLSQHVQARACDPGETTRLRCGPERFDEVCHRVFRNGGIGTQGTPSGPVRHVDSRPGVARWTY